MKTNQKFVKVICWLGIGLVVLCGAGCAEYSYFSQSIPSPNKMNTGIVARGYLYARGDRGKGYTESSEKHVEFGIDDKNDHKLDYVQLRIPSGYLQWECQWLDSEEIDVVFYNDIPSMHAPVIGTWKIHLDAAKGKIIKDEWIPIEPKMNPQANQ